jgi:hypothetical protein
LNFGNNVVGGSVSTSTTYWGFYANNVSVLPLGSPSVQVLLLFSPNAFSTGAGGSTSLPANTYYINIASGSSLTITASSSINNFAVVSTSSSWSINTGSTTVAAFTCCFVNGGGSASGSISVSGANSCSGFIF